MYLEKEYPADDPKARRGNLVSGMRNGTSSISASYAGSPVATKMVTAVEKHRKIQPDAPVQSTGCQPTNGDPELFGYPDGVTMPMDESRQKAHHQRGWQILPSLCLSGTPLGTASPACESLEINFLIGWQHPHPSGPRCLRHRRTE
ncbi:hypothetical protein FN846DRAFT_885967 [Sphaerosporella brunnea]|uniref:Uncharacterized protein n=1 Tax=Sphaerosporella brunnea TaxID=1250544 RepID=A0A5J5FBG4_9PEZI|nr:hypothetical protein FN846DRAFT_885967 [Sphaerosporella brunnea]